MNKQTDQMNNPRQDYTIIITHSYMSENHHLLYDCAHPLGEIQIEQQ